MMHLSQNLKLIRLSSNKTQTEFGELFGATKAMIVSYEKGKANPDDLFIKKVAAYAKVSERQLKNDDLSEKLLNVEIVEDEVSQKKGLNQLMGEHEERLLRIEAHLEVFQDAIAGLQAENKNDFVKKVGALRQEVQAAVNRRFDELQKKHSGL